MRISSEEYSKLFPEDLRAEALKAAHDIRKFEIELYWKRAAYFWTFIGVSFGGYFALQNSEIIGILFVACLGFLFSLAWYFVNCGSASWQRNWEIHVDLLEDAITGPLYKTNIGRRSHSFWRLAEPFPFSPTRMNSILALCVTCTWVFLIIRTLLKAFQPLPQWLMDVYPGMGARALILVILTAVAAIYLGFAGRAQQPSAPITLGEIDLRTYELTSLSPPSSRRR